MDKIFDILMRSGVGEGMPQFYFDGEQNVEMEHAFLEKVRGGEIRDIYKEPSRIRFRVKDTVIDIRKRDADNVNLHIFDMDAAKVLFNETIDKTECIKYMLSKYGKR